MAESPQEPETDRHLRAAVSGEVDTTGLGAPDTAGHVRAALGELHGMIMEDMLILYADGMLDEESNAAIEEVLLNEEEARAFLDEYRQIKKRGNEPDCRADAEAFMSDFWQVVEQRERASEGAAPPTPNVVPMEPDPGPSVYDRQVLLKRVRPWGLGIAAAAAIVIILFPPWKKTQQPIESWVVQRQQVLGAPKFEGKLATNRPVFVGLVMIDERYERWTIRSGLNGEYMVKVDQPWTFLVEGRPDASNPAAPKGISLGVIVSESAALSEQDILLTIPDPVVSPEATREALDAALLEIAKKMEAKFGCEVRWAPIPAH